VPYAEVQMLPYREPAKHCYKVRRLGAIPAGRWEEKVPHVAPFTPSTHCCPRAELPLTLVVLSDKSPGNTQKEIWP